MNEIAVVGGGPVGCLLAIVLAKRGHRVHIFERRPDIRVAKISAGRSINLALSVRGIHALSECGIANEVLSRAVPMYGRMMHAVSDERTFQRYGLDDSQYINSISRGELNRALLSRAEKENNIRISFQQKCVGFEYESRTLRFQDEKSGQESKQSFHYVIGTDGSASIIRDQLKKNGFLQSSESLLDYGYKELNIPAGPNGSFLLDKNALHIWPRGNHMLIALPNYDGSFTATLFLPWKGDISFDSISNIEKARAFFEISFPDALELLTHFEQDFQNNPTGQMVTVRTQPWTVGGSVLLVGDAAHAIVPFFGQGLNCGFEDCSIFDQILGTTSQLEKAFQIFASERPADANAIADLALDNFVEMRDKVAHQRFLLEKEIEKALMQRFPQIYSSRYSLVTFSRTPYRKAQRVGQIQDRILKELSEGIDSADKVDFAKAEKLIRDHLVNALE